MPTELEDHLIRYAREAARNRSRSLMKSSCPQLLKDAFQAARMTGKWDVLTPRGLDLFLTAEHVGYDPDAKTTALEIAPPTQPCGTCKGEGRVLVGTQQSTSLRGMKALVESLDGTERDPDPLLREADASEQAEVLPGWDVTCGECKGAKVVPVSLTVRRLPKSGGRLCSPFGGTFAIGPQQVDVPEGSTITEAAELIHASLIGYSAEAVVWSIKVTPLAWNDPTLIPPYNTKACETGRTPSGASEWIDFICLADVEGWEGATIEVRHRDGAHHRAQLVKEIKHCTNLAVVHGERRSYSSHAGWQFRKLTPVEKPQALSSKWAAVHPSASWTIEELKAATTRARANNQGHASVREALALGIISHGEADARLKALNE